MQRRKTAVFFLILCISLSVLAVVLNIGWILLNLREVALLVFGVIVFALIITGLILNTIFLLREIRRNEQHDAFLNAVTHELKTPIASIKLYLDTLRSRELTPEKRLEFYDIMAADNDRLLTTVEQVLQASRTREKQRLLDLSDIDMADLINETVKIVSFRNHLDDGEIRFTHPADKVVVHGDRTELQTAIANLIDNSVKYSPGGPKIAIKLRSSSGNGEIYIKDNGVGMDRSELKRVFKRFYRVPRKNAAKGTGLGLMIVRSIIERHGGRVWAESRGEGLGSTFVIRLPLS